MHNNNGVEFKVFGDYALFTDPVTKPGGERATYPVPTYEALKGILMAVYWKPTLIWFIDEVRIMNPIRTESRGIVYADFGQEGSVGKDLATCTFLKDVEYQVRAHFEWNLNRPELKDDRNPGKHLEIARRSIGKGGRRNIFLGTTECYAYVEPCAFGSGKGAYDEAGRTDLGFMYHGITYPDENWMLNGADKARPIINFWNASMEKGIIRFPRPEACITRKYLPDEMKVKPFGLEYGNVTPVENER